MSYIKIDVTAITSADPVDVTAIIMMSKTKKSPDLPINA